MNLGLLDILAMQQVEKPDYASRAGNNANRPDANNDSFRTYLEKPKKTSEDKSDPVAANIARRSNVEADANVSELGYQVSSDNKNLTPDTGTFKISKDALSKEPVPKELVGSSVVAKNTSDNNSQLLAALNNVAEDSINILTQSGSEDKESLIQVFNTLKTIKDASTASGGQNPLTTLIPLQEAGFEPDKSQIVPVGNIVKNLGQSISDAFNEIAENGLQSVVSSDAIENVTITELGSAINEPALNAGDITAIAGDVIEIAKTIAETPEVVELDVKSGQVASLLKGQGGVDGDGDGNNKNNNIVVNKAGNEGVDINAQKTPNHQNGAQVITQNMQSFIDDKAAHNERLANGAEAGTNSTVNALVKAAVDGAGNGKGDSNSSSNFSNQANNLLAQASSQNSQNVGGIHDFVKFQQYVDTADNTMKNIAGNNNAKAQDVLAQIKFGMSSVSAKGDSKITIQLHPKELGAVDVHIETGKDGKTKIAIMAEKTDTLNLLQKDSGSLKEMLQDALQTSSADLSFSFHENNDQQWKEMINEVYGNSQGLGDDADEDNLSNIGAYGQSFIATEGLDIRV